jgi:hypothetical protein
VYLRELIVRGIHPAIDHTVFRAAFAETLRTKEEYSIPIMLKSSPSNQVNISAAGSKDTVFDVKLYPHTFGEGNEGRTTCVFAMSSPSPIRDMAMCIYSWVVKTTLILCPHIGA